jgi:N-acetylmuramoyl-L-alanine amidase
LTQSTQLEARIGAALQRAKLPLVSSRASVRPVDSLTCPAVVVELAPQNDDRNSITDGDYQQRIAEAIAGALVFWAQQVQPPPLLPGGHAAETAVQP